MEFLRNNWPLVVALAAISAAYGETRLQVSENKEDIATVQENREQLIRTDEQVKHLRNDIQMQQRTLDAILKELRDSND